jgi:hypothetical protein
MGADAVMKQNQLAAFGLAAVAALSLAGAARAQTTPNRDDVRCLVVSMAVLELGGQTGQSAGMMSALYFLGRLDGREPDLDLENSLIDEISAMKPADVRVEAVRCGGQLAMRGKILQNVGQHLMERGKVIPNPAIGNE